MKQTKGGKRAMKQAKIINDKRHQRANNSENSLMGGKSAEE